MRNNYRKICHNYVALMNKLDYYPHCGKYILYNAGRSHHALSINDNKRLSSYLPWSMLVEWLDGYMTSTKEQYYSDMEGE